MDIKSLSKNSFFYLDLWVTSRTYMFSLSTICFCVHIAATKMESNLWHSYNTKTILYTLILTNFSHLYRSELLHRVR